MNHRNKTILLWLTLVIVLIGGLMFIIQIPEEKKNGLNNEHIDFIPINELTVKIDEYEHYYRSQTILPATIAKEFALTNTIDLFARLTLFAQYDDRWDEEQKDFARNVALRKLNAEMEIPHLKHYYERLFTELNISKKQYLDDYVLLHRELEDIESKLGSSQLHITFDQFALSNELEYYLEKIGMTEQQYYQFGNEIQAFETPLNPQPQLPFRFDEQDKMDKLKLQVGQNENGHYYFTNSPWINNCMFIMLIY